MASFHRYETASGDTRWRISYRKHHGTQGTKRGFTTKRSAQQWWAAHGAEVSAEPAETPPVSVYWDQVQRRYADQWKDSTKAVRHRSWRHHIQPHFGSTPVSTITHRAVQEWIDEVASKYSSPSSPTHAVTLLRLILTEARRDGAIDGDPTRDLIIRVGNEASRKKRKKTNQGAAITPDEIISWDQVQLIIDQIRYSDYADIVRVLATTGMRWGEAAALRPEDIDLDASRIRVARTISALGPDYASVRTPKTGKVRFVAFPAALRETLERRVADTPEGQFLFRPPHEGDFLRSPGAGRWFGTAVDAARKIDPTIPEGFHPHALRHTAVSRWLDAGVPMTVVAHQVGHSSTRTTEAVYAHIMPDSLDKIADLDPA